MIYRRTYNHPMPGSLNYAENLLYMMDKLNEIDYKPDPRLVKILDKMFILLAGRGISLIIACFCTNGLLVLFKQNRAWKQLLNSDYETFGIQRRRSLYRSFWCRWCFVWRTQKVFLTPTSW